MCDAPEFEGVLYSLYKTSKFTTAIAAAKPTPVTYCKYASIVTIITLIDYCIYERLFNG